MPLHCTLKRTCWGILLTFLIGGVVDCVLQISTISPPVVNATVGDNVTLAVRFTGVSNPTVEWSKGNETIANWIIGSGGKPVTSSKFGALDIDGNGSLTLHNVRLNYSGTYMVRMSKTDQAPVTATFTLGVFERPSGSPLCSVGGTGSGDLQYRCKWPGGNPQATLAFPVLDAIRNGSGDFNLTVAGTPALSGKEIICRGTHPLTSQNCSVTARGPAEFRPVFAVALDDNGTVVVSITCASASVPLANMTWSRGGQVITSGGRYQISPDTTVLSIVDPVLDTSNLGIYICYTANPVGRAESNVHVLGPTILDSSLSSNQDGTMVKLSWETPPTSIVTAFQVQMTGPDLTRSSGSSRRRKRATEDFRTVQQLAATARSTDLGLLDPKSSYQFRVVPVAGQATGQPSQEHHAGPGGLSEAAIAGIAAGVPCAILLLILLILLIVCCACKRKRRETRYPVSRPVDKAVVTQPNLNAPHKLLTGGMKSLGPPDYNLHQAPSERSSTLPYQVSLPAVRMATTV